MNIEPQYLLWCIINLEHFCLSSLVLSVLNKEDILFKQACIINKTKDAIFEAKRSREYELYMEAQAEDARYDYAKDEYFNAFLEGDWSNESNID